MFDFSVIYFMNPSRTLIGMDDHEASTIRAMVKTTAQRLQRRRVARMERPTDLEHAPDAVPEMQAEQADREDVADAKTHQTWKPATTLW